ncbi:putative transcription factor bHLH family [Lupinus albus]|uniref:Putative transcription factor bHLH family n=1 Tax=Lupinus albus TaxID=3870 RepID=A0A6A4PPU2_LUPAL|nr:putative transcription factor bHLH family [Lupinus albus]
MESNNLHHLQQDQPPLVEPSSLTLSSYGSLGESTHSWTPNITLNACNFIPNLQEANARSRSSMHKSDMIQDLGYHHHQWTSDAESCLAPRFSEMLNNTTSNMEDYQYHNRFHSTSTTEINRMKNNSEHKDMDSLNEKLLLKTLFSGDIYSTKAENYANNNFGGGTHGVPSRGNFSQIYPSINISNLNPLSSSSTVPISSPLNIMSTAQPLDLLTSPTSFPAGFNHPSHSQDHGFGNDNLSFRLHHMHQPSHRSSCNNSSNLSHFTNGTTETKRPCTLMQSKASQSQTASKKSRLESRPSCSPIKVRKEKLGDRIAALQQLVAPFGKTDTASVLMEAIGYIKFLQCQVETLSAPYMKSSQNQNNRVMQRSSAIGEANEEPKEDLRSRGLCLVPLSSISYIAGDGGTEVWQQPNFV